MVISFTGGGNQTTLEKTTDLLQVTEKLNIISRTPCHEPKQFYWTDLKVDLYTKKPKGSEKMLRNLNVQSHLQLTNIVLFKKFLQFKSCESTPLT